MLSASKPKSNDSKKVNILSKLPPELSGQALSFLKSNEVNAVIKVNKEHKALSEDNFLWFNLYTPKKTDYAKKIDYKALVKKKVELEKLQKLQELRRGLAQFADLLRRRYYQGQGISKKERYSLFFYQLEQNLLEISSQNNNILIGALLFMLTQYQQERNASSIFNLVLFDAQGFGGAGFQFIQDIKNYLESIPNNRIECLNAFHQYIDRLPAHSQNALGTREKLLTQITELQNQHFQVLRSSKALFMA